MNKKQIRPVAIYLPQFHPIPENDVWWEKGFTEWTNVTKAKPLFKSHYQPHLPADLGFYDLRLSEVREQQAMLAKAYGIYGFCYYHYWFNGRRLLERPFNEVLESGKPDFPLMLFWANETWSRRWLGEERDILLKQTYSTEDDYNHAEFLVTVFKDKRYITIDNRPVFIIYRPFDLPNISDTLNILRTVSKQNGFNPFLVANNSHAPLNSEQRLLDLGFDSVLNFMPQLGILPDVFKDRFLWSKLKRNFLKHGILNGKFKIYDHKEALKLMHRIEPKNFENIIPTVFVGWDNTPRRNENAIILHGNNILCFKEELKRAKAKVLKSEGPSDLILINAWNEWAEGNHLEPDLNGTGQNFLEAVGEILNN